MIASTHAKAKRRNASRHMVPVVAMLLFVSACDYPIETAWNKQRTIAHYLANEAAFDRLAQVLEADELTQEASYTPANVQTFSRASADEEKLIEAERTNQLYGPLLKDLSFKGQIFFYRTNTGDFVFPNFGGDIISRGNEQGELTLSLMFIPDAERRVEGCESSTHALENEGKTESFHRETCQEQIDEGWFLEQTEIIWSRPDD